MDDRTKLVAVGALALLGSGLAFYFWNKSRKADKTITEMQESFLDLQMEGTGLAGIRGVQRVGSLHMPLQGLTPQMRMGLIQATQRYQPRHGVNL